MTAYIDVRITFEETVIDEGEEDSFTDYTPKKIYVLQNRRYRKANRALVSVMGGMGLTNAFLSALAGDQTYSVTDF